MLGIGRLLPIRLIFHVRVSTFLNAICISTPMIFHPLELVSKLFNIGFQRSQTLCRFRSTMFFNSFEDIISSRTIFISPKTTLFSCRLFHRKRVQFVTKLIFLVCQDEGKILEHCLCPCPTFSQFPTCFHRRLVYKAFIVFKRWLFIIGARILSVIRLDIGNTCMSDICFLVVLTQQ